MCEYLILQHPGHNRVYYNLSAKLALAELQLAAKRFSLRNTEVSVIEISQIRYFSIKSLELLSINDLQIISKLSFVFALFQVKELDNSKCLIPISLQKEEYVDSKIGSLLKYAGKTNELFTKMMINVALLSSDFTYQADIHLLDPVAGKGTTLYEAAVYGYKTSGIELEPKSVNETITFFKKFIQTEKYKHSFEKRQVYGSSKSEAIFVNEFSYARTKEEFKSDNGKHHFALVNGNSVNANKFFKKNTFNIIVGDLPYGIAHGNTASQKTNGITRNPKELLEACLASWTYTLKPGGIIVVAWNSFLVSRLQLEGVFTAVGLEVLNGEPYCNFEHMVDKSIKRDIIVAKKVS